MNLYFGTSYFKELNYYEGQKFEKELKNYVEGSPIEKQIRSFINSQDKEKNASKKRVLFFTGYYLLYLGS